MVCSNQEELASHDRKNPDRLSAPFAVNQIVHKSNARLDEDMAMCEKHKVPMIISSLGARVDLNDAIHRWGGIVFHDVINQTFAHKAIEKGADGLILVAAGAGGHAGTVSPFGFVSETREWFDGPIALSGAIGNGRAIRAARALGADFAYIGTAFIATHEANACRTIRIWLLPKTLMISFTRIFSAEFTPTILETPSVPRVRSRCASDIRQIPNGFHRSGKCGEKKEGLEGYLGQWPRHRQHQGNRLSRRSYRALAQGI